MTLDEARDHIGEKVVYRSEGGDRKEEGVIAAVSSVYAFVQYGEQRGVMATHPEDLTLPGDSGAVHHG